MFKMDLVGQSSKLKAQSKKAEKRESRQDAAPTQF
jgi:hypothetical protein